MATSYNKTDHSIGLLSPEQRKAFLQVVWSMRPLLQRVSKVLMPNEDFSTLGIYATGSGLSAMDTDEQDISLDESADELYKVNLKAYEYALSRSIDLNYLQDNIEGQNFGKTITNIMAQKSAENLLDAGINSQIVTPTPSAGTTSAVANVVGATELILTVDPLTLDFLPDSRAGYLVWNNGSTNMYMTYTGIDSANTKFIGLKKSVKPYNIGTYLVDTEIPASATISWVDHKLRKKQTGWIETLENGNSLNTNALTSNILDGSTINSGSLIIDHLRSAEKLIDSSFLNPSKYVWLMSKDQAYKLETNMIAVAGSNLKDLLYQGGEFKPLGYDVMILEDKFIPTDRVVFGDPQNLILGYYKNVSIRSTEEGKQAINTNKRFYSLRTRVAFGVQYGESFTVINGLV